MSKRKSLIAVIWLPALLVLLSACGGADTAAPATTVVPAASANNEKLDVVATFSILGDLVQNVGGDRVAVRTLVGPGGDAHTFEPSPADSVALSEASLVFENGLGFEPWLDELYTSSGSRATRVVVTERIEPTKVMEGGEQAERDQPGHAESDPHVWSDAGNAIRMVESIRDALAKADTANADAYNANAEGYLAELKGLDDFIVAETNKLPPQRRKLVTIHDTFGYFARRYGYEMVGTALGSTSTEAADPSAGELANLIEQIKAAGVPAIFAENVHNPDLMNRIAAEAGVKLGPSLYTDALGEPGSEGDTYLKMMRYNVSAIVTALGS
ncbi:MAG TPA: zinc ABC transporter substrate-binding protein [Roseiflexaceae bacterium]|nr:zinc ABC transporter substrate-binding protein [Roseiflexaceae bacterium]